MPGGNKMGPMNEGPMTGRGLGNCASPNRAGGNANYGYRANLGYGRGRNFGCGRGFGVRRGFGIGRGAGMQRGVAFVNNGGYEVSLEDQKAELTRMLDEINKQLENE